MAGLDLVLGWLPQHDDESAKTENLIPSLFDSCQEEENEKIMFLDVESKMVMATTTMMAENDEDEEVKSKYYDYYSCEAFARRVVCKLKSWLMLGWLDGSQGFVRILLRLANQKTVKKLSHRGSTESAQQIYYKCFTPNQDVVEGT